MQRGAFIVLVLSALIACTIAGGEKASCNEEGHEVPTNCTTTCGGTCASQGQIINCPNQLISNCKTGCTCAEGYTRLDNSTGSPCVLISSCPSDNSPLTDCGPNTVRIQGCTGICQPSCDVQEPIPFCPAICILNGCVCKDGYIRLKSISTPCVRKSNCPKPCTEKPPPIECGKHEVPTNCTTTCGGTCASQGKIIHCPIQLIANCKPGCTCAEGYTRLDNSTGSPCVLISSCPSDTPTDLNCGPNTVPVTSGCVDYCPPTCAVREPKICPRICIQNGCNCKEGYIRSEDRNSLCIRPSQCPCTKQKGSVQPELLNVQHAD